MKFSPQLVYHQDLEYYLKDFRMELLEALFDKETFHKELKTQKLKVAKLEEQNLRVLWRFEELDDLEDLLTFRRPNPVIYLC